MSLINLEEQKEKQEILLLQEEIKQLIYDKKILAAIELIANKIIENNNIKTIRDDKNEEMYIYRDGIYLENAKTYIKEFSELILGTQYTKQKANNIIEKIIAKTYIDYEDFFGQQTINKFLIPVKNGILDVKNNKIIPFSPNYYFFNKLNIYFNEEKESKKIISFIKQITRSEEDVKVIQELFGFSLVKDYIIEKAIMFYGEHGRNGKSKLLEILEIFVGINNVSSIDLQDFSNDTFAVSNLRNKLINIGSDISNDDINSTGIFKKLTGRDTIQANRKNQSRIQFVNYAKMIFAANELPPIRTNSDAFWERWVIIEFPYQFLPKKEIEALNKEGKDTSNIFLQNPTIIDNLIDDDELSGLLNWAVKGLNSLLSNKDFSNKDTISDIRISWLRKSNSVSAFIIDEIEEDYDGFVSKSDFKKRYLAYCRENNIKSLSDKLIKRTIETDIGATTGRRNIFIEGHSNDFSYVWEGIRFKTKTVTIPDVNKSLKDSVNVSEEFVNDDLIDKMISEGKLYQSSPGVYRRLE